MLFLKSKTVLVSGLIAALAAFSASAALAESGAVGAISPDNGYPIYYENADEVNGVDVQTVSPGVNGQPLRLSLCLKNNGLCLLDGDVTLIDPQLPFPANYGGTFPDEAFYWTGDAEVVTTNGGDGMLIMALEAAFLNEAVIDGDQIVFGRIRLRIDNLIAGEEYTLTTPFGVFNEVAEAAGRRGINMTEDIGGFLEASFDVVLGAKVGPFLVPVGFDPDSPAVTDADGIGYIADPNVLTAVTGSVITNAHAFGAAAVPGPANFFRIEGPSVGIGSPDQCADPGLGGDPVATDDCVETDQFLISGQIAANFGVQPVRTTYTRNANSNGRIDVLVTSIPDQIITAGISGRTITLLEDPNDTGRYFGRFTFNGNFPLEERVTLVNETDIPDTVTSSPIVDAIQIRVATFRTDDLELNSVGMLTLRANGSDNTSDANEQPALEAFDNFGDQLFCSADGVNNLVASLPDNAVVICPTFPLNSVTVRSVRNPNALVGGGGEADQDALIAGPNISGP